MVHVSINLAVSTVVFGSLMSHCGIISVYVFICLIVVGCFLRFLYGLKAGGGRCCIYDAIQSAAPSASVRTESDSNSPRSCSKSSVTGSKALS